MKKYIFAGAIIVIFTLIGVAAAFAPQKSASKGNGNSQVQSTEIKKIPGNTVTESKDLATAKSHVQASSVAESQSKAIEASKSAAQSQSIAQSKQKVQESQSVSKAKASASSASAAAEAKKQAALKEIYDEGASKAATLDQQLADARAKGENGTNGQVVEYVKDKNGNVIWQENFASWAEANQAAYNWAEQNLDTAYTWGGDWQAQ